MFFVKFVVEIVIPDVPSNIALENAKISFVKEELLKKVHKMHEEADWDQDPERIEDHAERAATTANDESIRTSPNLQETKETEEKPLPHSVSRS